MKKSLLGLIPLSLIAGLIYAGCAAQKEVTLELLNPMGVIEPPVTLGLSARIPDLDGKKIALIQNNKPGAANLFDALEELLQAKYPGATIVRQFQTDPVLPPKDPEFYKKAAVVCRVIQ